VGLSESERQALATSERVRARLVRSYFKAENTKGPGRNSTVDGRNEELLSQDKRRQCSVLTCYGLPRRTDLIQEIEPNVPWPAAKGFANSPAEVHTHPTLS